jgi:hypothetical protein
MQVGWGCPAICRNNSSIINLSEYLENKVETKLPGGILRPKISFTHLVSLELSSILIK